MRFLADDNFPGAAVAALRSAGHDVVWVRTAAPGSDDLDVLERAVRETRILVTFDKDFGALARTASLPSGCGVVLVRMAMPRPAEVARIADAIMARDGWAGHFCVIEPGRVRMRPLGRARVAVSYQEIREAHEFLNADGMGNQAFLCRESGKIYWHSEVGDDFDELPEDLEEGEKYLALPDRRELDLGKPLVLAFADEIMPDDLEEIRRIFSRRGAYGRFKDLLQRRRMLERWYDYHEKATERALRAWCEDNDVALVDRRPED